MIQLTDQQKIVLGGEAGSFLARYMGWMVTWGEAMGARRLVPVTNVHCILRTPTLGGASAKTIKTYIKEIRQICSHRVKCTATTHVRKGQIEDLAQMGISREEIAFQRELPGLARKAGFLTISSCTPYLAGNVPTCGEICAWTESSAVIYANSILGARTTRHGMESSIAAALLGWVPEFGILISRNRKASLQIDLEATMRTSSDWGALGAWAGGIAGSRIPVFNRVKVILPEGAKQLSAALPYWGRALSMFHIAGLTPEAPDLETAMADHKSVQRVVFTEKDLQASYQEMTSLKKGEAVDMVIIGCPFTSLREIKEVADGLENRRIRPGVRLWICTSYGTMRSAERMGYTTIIERAGGAIRVDACPGAAGFPEPTNVVINSFKQAFFFRNNSRAGIGITSLRECVEVAIRGRWL